MLHKSSSSIEEVPYCFWRSFVKFQGHMAKKIVDFDPNYVFLDCYSSWIHQWLRNDAKSLESSIEEVPYCFLGSSIKFRGHTGWKINDLNSIWVRLLGRSQLSNPSDLPYLDVWTQIPFRFLSHTYNHSNCLLSVFYPAGKHLCSNKIDFPPYPSDTRPILFGIMPLFALHLPFVQWRHYSVT